jgi:hypothetical protein
MPKGAHVEVQVKCDYCGKVVPKNYYDYNNQRKNSIVKKDACIKCAHLKRNESVEIHEQLNIPFEKRQKSNSNQRLSLEFIQQVFKNKNCTLITDFYKNNKQDLEYICNIHTDKGVQHTTYHCFQKTIGCTYCANKQRAEKRRKDFEIVKEDYKKMGFTLLTDNYKNNLTKMPCVCNNHKEIVQHIPYSQIQQGHGCIICWNERQGDLYRFDYAYIKEEYLKRNIILLEDTYVNNGVKNKCICKNHPDKIQYISYSTLVVNDGCKYCNYEKRNGIPYQPWFARTKNLSSYLRHFINEWQIKTMEKDNYKCVITGKKFEVIHHLYPFNKIVKETIECLGLPVYKDLLKYTENEMKTIENKCLELHFKHGLGVCLTKEMHDKFHSLYGKTNCNLEQFEQFKNFIQYEISMKEVNII